MVKGKVSTSSTGHQTTLKSFFGGGGEKSKPKPKAKPRSARVEDIADEGASSDDQTEATTAVEDAVVTDSEPGSEGGPPTRPTSAEPSDTEMGDAADDSEEKDVVTKKSGKAPAPDASSLPPINKIPAIFDDLVFNIPEIKGVAEHVKGRKLRVATMCSGTESPLLALELIQKSIREQHGISFGIEHVFSCEIEPFKQAYIERNFQPPILFRDVCELGDKEAHTAYGALVPVPGDVDMLVAGTSCVDYSNLNNEKQDIDANGESGRTFRGMMSWVTNHRPPIVILENVCSAPWEKVKAYFVKCGYSAEWARVDTKNYYIPHTRTRVYLIAVDKKSSSIPDKWKDMVMNQLKRPASSTLDAFLLPSDDPRIHLAREKLVRESYGGPEKRTGRTDWTRCESRHQRARLEEQLGAKRPLTSWDDGGFCKLPDFAWNDWGVAQVERVWDLMDISMLRSATRGVDPSYKTVVWNLSQNVDRTIGSNKVGICPCLTPSMIPYITNRGGPMVGLEALSMQGLPVDKLLLTRESEDQLADLAGNAMSSTVVGACILAALVCSKKLLKAGDDEETYESKKDLGEEPALEPMDVEGIATTAPAARADILGEEKLDKQSLNLSPTSELSLDELLSHATQSARLCVCEGRTGMTDRELFRCRDCLNTFCKKCGGRPEHNAEPCADVRTHPSDFAKKIKSALPMSLSLTGMTDALPNALKEEGDVAIKPAVWAKWHKAVLAMKEHDIRFVELKRQELWSAIFQSPTATLELILHPQRPEWRLFAIPDADEPASAQIRQILIHPVARLVCSDGLLSGNWEFALPAPVTFRITIEGTGELVPSWEARLGLVGEAFKDKMVYSQVKITVPGDYAELLDRDIAGEYVLLDKCGTANGALHKKIPTPEEKDLPPLFMLFDPHRTNDDEDCFVISSNIRRLEYMETRPMVCKLDPKWRQSDVVGEQKVVAHLPWKWVKTSSVNLKASEVHEATYGIPTGSLELDMAPGACGSAYALLSCSLPLDSRAGPEWPRGKWGEVDKVNEKSIFKSLAWLLEPIRHVGDNFRTWQGLKLPTNFVCRCESCAPSPPSIRWVQAKKKFIPLEDPVQAGEYERRLKRRPSPFVTQLKLDENGSAAVRIGINIPSLVHRALASLPVKDAAPTPTLSWRLDTNYTPSAAIAPAKFRLLSNKEDEEHAQPPHFKIPLRPEQLRSLTWMIQQESAEAPNFVEEEIAEAILDPMGWRAEGKAERPVRVLGGVLADQVGYGKTAITLGLIDCTQADVKAEFKKAKIEKGSIRSAATLIVVPSHLPKQWHSETKKFLQDKKFKVVILKSVTDLNKQTIHDIQNADIVIASSTLQTSDAYVENLSQFAGVADFPTPKSASNIRPFRNHLRKATEALRGQVDRLRDEGAGAVLTEIQEAAARVAKDAEEAAAASVVSKRLKGKSYREAVEQNEKEAVDDEEASDAKPTKASRKTAKPAPKIAKREPSSSPGPESFQGKATRAPSGKIPEVVITSRPRGNATSSSPALSEDGQEKRPRRAKARSKNVIPSDDEDEDDEPAPKPSAKKAKAKAAKTTKAKGKKKPQDPEDSDFKISNDEESEADQSFDESEASEASSSARKRKAKSQPAKRPAKKPVRGKGKAKAVSDSDDGGDAMDVDEEEGTKRKAPAKKAAGKKRKAEDDDDGPEKKKKKRSNTDPWKLASSAVKSDWTDMACPPLEMFRFARIVVDEYTYVEGNIYSMVTNLVSDRRWVLSGTPPTHDFAAVKSIAAFLKLHLGIDDISEGQAHEVQKRAKDLTSVEKFHSFREVHSPEWHAHRVTVGQRFLDQFVRQNVAEIDEIQWEIKKLVVTLPAAERAIYLELEHHLRALDMTIKRGRKNDGDREKRLNKSLGESKTAEEALLKRCSHFDLDTEKDNENAVKACDVIVQEREEQLEQCKVALLESIKEGVKREKDLAKIANQESMFNEYIRVCRTEGLDDAEATEVIIDILDEAGAGPGKQPKLEKERTLTENQKANIWEHREKTHEIRRVTKELVGRIRSLRYFTVVRDIQKHKAGRKPVDCPGCGKSIPLSNVAVLSSCGHEGCVACVKECAEREECVYAASGKCKSAARVINIVRAETLGEDDIQRDAKGKHFGRKLERVVDLIKNEIPKEDRVLIFVQYPDLIKKLIAALEHKKIEWIQIKGGSNKESDQLDQFQNKDTGRVLILNVMDEKAAGANLTCANHAVFLSPLFATSDENYKASETQAIGRLVRFGQRKPVTVWRLVAADTIDEEIYEQRKAALATAPVK